jgi:flagellar protein FliS
MRPLIDSALQHISSARSRMGEADSRERHHYLHAAVQLVGELRSSLDVHAGGPYAVNLDDLCDYMSRQLVAATVQNRTAALDEVSDLLREARTAWMMVTLCMTERIQ